MIFEGSGVAIDGRALLIEGPPAAGKSSLALALIDRGATLIGDDAVRLVPTSQSPPLACPPPNIKGLIELRGIGIFEVQTQTNVPVSLILSLGKIARERIDRLPEVLQTRALLGGAIPVLPFDISPLASAQRAEWALRKHGI